MIAMADEEQISDLPKDKDREAVTLNFRIPPRMPSVYAHHMTVQPGECEILLSFFEIIPPLILGDPQVALERIKDSGVTAECVARVTIAKDRFGLFAESMHDIATSLGLIKLQDKETDAKSS